MKIKTKAKIAGIILIVCALAIVVSVIALKNHRSKTDSGDGAGVTPAASLSDTAVVSSQSAISATATVKPSDSLVYKNTDYGFQITFNDVWKGYTVRPIDFRDSYARAILGVYLPNENKSPLTIYVFEKNVWDKIDKSTSRSTKVAENSAYVFSYSTWEEPPANLVIITDKEIANIIKSFTIIQK